MNTPKFYRIAEVCSITGLRPSSIYKQIRLKKFPTGTKLTARSTGWRSDLIDGWIAERSAGNFK